MFADEPKLLKSMSGLENSRIEHEQQRWFTLPHTHALRVRWDIIQAFVLVYLAIAVPMRIGFSLEPEGFSYIVEFMVEIYFYFDMVLNFVTTYEDENMKVITDPGKIARHYLASWFMVDLISVLPVDLAIRISEGMFICSFNFDGCPDDKGTVSTAGQYVKVFKMLRLVRLVKLLRLARLSRLVVKYQDELFNVLRLMATLKLIVFLLYLGHIFGCIFYFFSDDEWLTQHERSIELQSWLIGMFGKETEDEGGAVVTVVDAPLLERYIAAAYWAFTTMTTVGYGDISANSVAERTFAILGMIVGGLMLSTIVSKIIIIFDEAHLHEKVMKAKMLQVEQWVKDIKLPKLTRSRVLTFYRRQDERPYNEGKLLMQLPFEMRCLVAKHMYKEFLDCVPFFCEGDDLFRTQLCVGFQPLKLMPHRYVYLHGEAATMMYVLQRGEVDVMDCTSGMPIGKLHVGAYFGEGAALGDALRKETIRSRTLVYLLGLPNTHMKGLLDRYPEVRLKMQAIYNKKLAVYNRRRALDTGATEIFLTHNPLGEVVKVEYKEPQRSWLQDSALADQQEASGQPEEKEPNRLSASWDFSAGALTSANAESSAQAAEVRAAPPHTGVCAQSLFVETSEIKMQLARLSSQMAETLKQMDCLHQKLDKLETQNLEKRVLGEE